ncbi:MAG: hypothetical protein LBN74_02310 [Prevotella sp.]|jgi:hypothetical protein|nr:hypothetical protein [Prevotella sp.]
MYNFKDKYPGVNMTDDALKWCSCLGDKDITWNQTTRQHPKNTHVNVGGNTDAAVTAYLLSSGIHTGVFSFSGAPANSFRHSIICGDSMDNTVLTQHPTYYQGDGRFRHDTYFNDIKLDFHVGDRGFSIMTCRNCDIKEFGTYTDIGLCKIRNAVTYTGNVSRISVIGAEEQELKGANVNLTLFDSSSIYIEDQTVLDKSIQTYQAFNNCTFKFGSETEYAALIGNTVAELRQNFVDRCTNQGFTVPTITEYGDTDLPAGRWIFSNNSAIDGLVLKYSDINLFEISRLIRFGYTDDRNDSIPITTDTTKAGSFNPAGANAALDVTDESISFQSNVDISQPNTGRADSNIIWLGGRKQLSKINLFNNFPMMNGVYVDSTPSLSNIPVTEVELQENGMYKMYIVRSTDEEIATVTYNGSTYSSSIVTRNNLFKSVSGVTTFTSSENAVVYEVLDFVVYNTIQMRVIDQIPTDIISAGNLQTGYWYLVEPNSPTDTTGTVTYNGNTYPAYGSFIAVNGVPNFTINGSAHLRRCYRQDYDNPNDEVTDLAFWLNKQKPKWVDVLPSDLRCLKYLNNDKQAEMQLDENNKYIASGHPDFYNKILGTNGVIEPSFNINGTYIQLRLLVTTLNPM